ncbi:unnamed protein product [Brachionus calyciflorus]|uniref:La-related protein 7 n=1 Tax=Brachionus calyciflorus TaxID=104777 RepID=A0A813M8R4_9BILA|nr:unnamed protein product [Brachionus calyciflorus]
MSTTDASETKAEELSKKDLRKKLLEQLEFYFSDSNLTKDRFLKKEIENSNEGFINLEIFLHFNKIRMLGLNLKDIRKSVKKSELLELNEDETMVRRITPFVELRQKDIDKKTIYVENIPSKITYEDLKEHFQQYGKISYISLPKFQSTNQLKGFAFIEYDQKDDSKKAVENFKAQTMELGEENIGKFPRANAQIIELEKKIKKVNEEIEKHIGKSETESRDSEVKKRKADLDEDEPNKKKTDKNQEKNKDKKRTNEEWFKNLKVVSKKKWIKSKEKFLENQKKENNELKEKLNELNKKLNDIKNSSLISSKTKIDDINRGCIIKIQLNLNNEKDYELFSMGRKQFKDKHLNGFDEQIAYVDMEKNSNKILIRCKSNDFAKSLLDNESFLTGFQKSLLKGEEENSYFEKISSNRNKKQEKKERKEMQKPFKQVEQKTKEKQPEIQSLRDEKSESKHIKFESNEFDN